MAGKNNGKQGGVSGDLIIQLERERLGLIKTLKLPWQSISHLSQALRPKTVTLICGPSNVGKSFFTTLIALGVHEQGESWAYLPLEDNKLFFNRRVLAILEQDYRIMDMEAHLSQWQIDCAEKHHVKLDEIASHVFENPREMLPGMKKVPKLPSGWVMDWLDQEMRENSAVFLDPTTQIEFSNQNRWGEEEDFVRELVGLAAHHECCLVLVNHPKNLHGHTGAITLEQMQGVSMWAKLVQNVIIMTSHEDKESEVFGDSFSTTREVTHNRTIQIEKARNGAGAKKHFAFIQSGTAPAFEELGIIKPGRKK